MDKFEAFEELAESVVFGTLTIWKLSELDFDLKEGKTLHDVSNAKHLKPGQQPGSFETMVAHVENNLKEVVQFIG